MTLFKQKIKDIDFEWHELWQRHFVRGQRSGRRFADSYTGRLADRTDSRYNAIGIDDFEGLAILDSSQDFGQFGSQFRNGHFVHRCM